MQRVVGQASAFVASSRAALAAALSSALAFSSRAKQAAARQWADTSPRLVLYARFLRGRAIRLEPPTVRLAAACAAVFLTLAALALPGGDNDKVLASVELELGARSGVVAGATVSDIPIEFPTQTAAKAGPSSEAGTSVAAKPVAVPVTPQADTPAPTKTPDLAGLAEIPEELIVNPPKKTKGNGPRKPSFAAYSETRESLPWEAVEPVVFTPMGPGEQQKPGEASARVAAPAPLKVSSAEIGKWMKGKATKIMGAQRTKPLYHFVVWVEPPTAMKGRVAGVSYDFSSPAVQPQSQASMDRDSGFKINAAGLVCADEITVTLRFKDGRVEKTNIDGCELFNKA